MTAETQTAPPHAGLMAFAASPTGKAGMILLLLLLLLIPLSAISGLIDERQQRQNDVQTEFRHTWGPAQTLAGPMLAVPYLTHPNTTITDRTWIMIAPAKLAVSADLQPELRRRGLFRSVIYTASVGLSGSFTIPRIDLGNRSTDDLLWNEAILVTSATDLRGQPAGATADVNGHAEPLLLNAITSACGGTVTASAQLTGAPAVGTTIPFRTNLILRGTQSLNVLPYGLQLDVHMASPWQTPGFTGSTLPATHDTDHAGFQADWQIAGDAVSGGWISGPTPSPLCAPQRPADAVFGVDLLEPVPTYVMVNRASKYGSLFLVLSFVTYFLFETVSHIRIHIVQYGLLGLSVSLFALLLVALAEPLGFLAGYAVSTAAVMAQASLYTLSVVGSARLAVLFATILGLLFGFLYIVLSLEAFSLLAGTLALFVVLSAIMAATRRLDWNR